jgi:hypothetical protein
MDHDSQQSRGTQIDRTLLENAREEYGIDNERQVFSKDRCKDLSLLLKTTT